MICPICGNKNMEDNVCDICAICGWEDDNVQQSDHNYAGGANHLSVNESRIEFLLLHTTKTKDEATRLKKRYYESIATIYKKYSPISYIKEADKADARKKRLFLARETYIDSLNELMLSLIDL